MIYEQTFQNYAGNKACLLSVKLSSERYSHIKCHDLTQELREAFDGEGRRTRTPPLLLTAGVSASREIIDTAYETNNLTRWDGGIRH